MSITTTSKWEFITAPAVRFPFLAQRPNTIRGLGGRVFGSRFAQTISPIAKTKDFLHRGLKFSAADAKGTLAMFLTMDRRRLASATA